MAGLNASDILSVLQNFIHFKETVQMIEKIGLLRCVWSTPPQELPSQLWRYNVQVQSKFLETADKGL